MALAGSARRAARRVPMPSARRRRRPLDRDRGALAGRVGTLRARIGNPQWTADPKFRTLYLRMRNREELDAQVARWAATQDAEAAMALLQGAGIAAGVALNGADLADRPAACRARFFAPVKLPDSSSTRVTGVPMRLSATPGSIRTVAPDVGEDNDYILGELLGLGRAERADLIAEGAVWG